MGLSNSYDFDMTVDEIIRKAAQRAGGGMLNGEELKDALKSLNLVFQNMSNEGIPLALIQRYVININAAQQDYILDECVSDIHHAVIRDTTSNTDIQMERYSLAQFNSLSKKDATGRPSIYTIERNYDNVTMRIWTVPTKSYEMHTYAMINPDDADRYTDNMRIQARYLPAVIAGLAVEIAADRNASPELIGFLQQIYEKRIGDARHEDRERVSYTITPETRRR